MKPTTHNSLVSIIIPVHNGSQWLKDSISSAVRQSHPDLEILVIDDGSTDDPGAVVAAFDDPRIRFLVQENRGAASARNTGLSHSSGEWVQFLDADDVLAPDKIETQLNAGGSARPLTVAACAWQRFRDVPGDSEQAPEPGWEERTPFDWLVDSLLGAGMFQTACWLTPRELVEKAGPWDESLTLHDDGEFFTRVLARAGDLRFVPEALVHYRAVPASLSRRRSAAAASSALRVAQSRATEMLAVEDSTRVRRALATAFFQVAYEFAGIYPDVVSRALREMREMGVRPDPDIGGPAFRLLARITGAHAAARLRSVLLGSMSNTAPPTERSEEPRSCAS